MNIDFINITLSFLEGFALIISPCILPILPIILSGSLEGDRKRPYGIILGFILAFALFTFFSRKIVQFSGIDLNVVRNISFGILILFGIIMISDFLTQIFERFTQGIAKLGFALTPENSSQTGFISGLLFGGVTGLIWTPCAGPILAAVIVQTVLQKTTISSFLIVLSFGIGAALPMLMIVLFGRGIISRFKFFKTKTRMFPKILGGIVIASVLLVIYTDGIAFSFDKSTDKSTLENPNTHVSLINKIPGHEQAPALKGISAWINSEPLTLEQLKGKVVLIDFWAYSCINCIRTLPYLKNWYQQYHDKGLVIIGVHSPEFDFERDYNNVKNAVEKYGILYPIALDNNFATWLNYGNHYWPAHYLIDKEGNLVYEHFGEGEYDVMDHNIRALLGIDKTNTKAPTEPAIRAYTPETYLGYARANQFHSPQPIIRDNLASYSYPEKLPENAWALEGSWKITPEKIIATAPNASIKIHFKATKVYAVMGNNTKKPILVKLLLNGELLLNEKGKDLKSSGIIVTDHTLYTVIEMDSVTSGFLELIVTEPGLELYTFTFG